ncbi:MAG: hypothetical protein RLN70_07730 [Rhodospirillaceae bacterium]|mgnify:CR=1 FL=1|jgi:hypothetical protein
MLQGIGAVLGPVVVGIAAWIGRNTFESWRQQKLSERRIEQAERILTATYKARRSLSYVRNPMMLGHELDAANATLKESGEWDKIIGGEQERERVATTQAYYNRLNRTLDDRRALEECQPMARALFGEQLEKAIETLNHQFRTVQIYVDANHRDRNDADTDFRGKISSAIFEGYPSSAENEIDQTVTAQVGIIESICLPILRLEAAKNIGR